MRYQANTVRQDETFTKRSIRESAKTVIRHVLIGSTVSETVYCSSIFLKYIARGICGRMDSRSKKVRTKGLSTIKPLVHYSCFLHQSSDYPSRRRWTISPTPIYPSHRLRRISVYSHFLHSFPESSISLQTSDVPRHSLGDSFLVQDKVQLNQ